MIVPEHEKLERVIYFDQQLERQRRIVDLIHRSEDGNMSIAIITSKCTGVTRMPDELRQCPTWALSLLHI